jgi:hypothetical protein
MCAHMHARMPVCCEAAAACTYSLTAAACAIVLVLFSVLCPTRSPCPCLSVVLQHVTCYQPVYLVLATPTNIAAPVLPGFQLPLLGKPCMI